MNIINSSFVKLIYCLISGALLTLAFAPFNYFLFAVIAPILLLLLWLHASTRESFWRGFIFGLGFFGTGVSWVYISIHQYGNTSAPLAFLITALFIAILASFIAIQGYLLARFFPNNTVIKFCLAFPTTWVLMEWTRSWIFTGFPWLLLGTSQINSPLRGFAPLIGEYGLSFLLLLTCGLLVTIFYSKNTLTKKLTLLSIILTIWCSGNWLANKQWTQADHKTIQVSLIQGNIPQQLKWDVNYIETTLQKYYQLTQKNWDSQLIIWPEAAIPLLQTEAQGFLDAMDKEAQQHHATLITGIPIKDGFTYYNAMIALGQYHAKYYKQHLVPFGEYVPLEKWLRGVIGLFDIPMSNFSSGSSQQPDFKLGNLIIAPFICYEIVYAQTVLNHLPQAGILLTISNDAWFGHSFASEQHLQIGQMRALETGRYLIFATNDGITAVINHTGKIEKQIPRFTQGTLTSVVPIMSGSTPFVRLGVTPLILFLAGLLCVTWINEKNKSC